MLSGDLSVFVKRQLLIETSDSGSWGPVDVRLFKILLLTWTTTNLQYKTHIVSHYNLNCVSAYSVRGRIHIILVFLICLPAALCLNNGEVYLLSLQYVEIGPLTVVGT